MVTIDVMTNTRPVREVLAWSRSVIEPAMRAAVDTLSPSMRRVAGYHFGWWDADEVPAGDAGGKVIRPTLTLLAAEAVGGSPDSAVPAAVAVEFVHNFSLLHDDVMDGDLSRRHRPTAWSVFGTGPAVLAGDAMLTLAFDVVASSTHPAAQDGMRMLSNAVQKLVSGQAEDVSFEQRADVKLSECLAMAGEKTGSLLACACAVGGLFGGGSASEIERLGRFGEKLGLAFQLVDDLLGIWGDSVVTGKPVYSDLASRKKSLPVVAALTSGTEAGAELSELYHREQPLSDDELVHAAELIDGAGGRSWSQERADGLLVEALSDLHTVETSPRAVAELAALAWLTTHRDH
ncbi:MAG: polyprenyl synthetase family protein [Kutzneria sp.]|nr:polyprenyl synthetase family protein [Kutzneria sp.]